MLTLKGRTEEWTREGEGHDQRRPSLIFPWGATLHSHKAVFGSEQLFAQLTSAQVGLMGSGRRGRW